MKKVYTEIVCALLVTVFFYAALSKILDQQKFVIQMGLSPLPVMKIAAPFLSWFLPAVELIAVVLLLPYRTRLKGLYLSLALFIVFEVYIGAMLLSGLHLPCTCGGLISKMTWKQHLLFNALSIILTVTCIRKSKYAFTGNTSVQHFSRA
jgi:putative oxidoreductase